MKKKIYSFIIVSLATLCIAPSANMYMLNSADAKKPKTLNDWKTYLYNMDFALQFIGRAYYHAGISINPEKVIIGKSGWLFLGDSYAKSITVKRNSPSPEDEVKSKAIAGSASGWNKWFHDHGVKEYRVIIGPDKDTIYAEYLPDWARHSQKSLTDQMIGLSGESIFIYPKTALISEKAKYNTPIYYKTDTHWNLIGGAIAFQQLSKSLSHSQPDLLWPDPIDQNDVSMSDRVGGDLSNFQRIREYLQDSDVRLQPFVSSPIKSQQTEFFTGNPVTPGSNTDVRILTTATLVKSPNALNNKRVLWLRDSFGSALAPFMAATFSETLQLHHNRASQKMIEELVEEFKPDYVIVTNVERDSRTGFLTSRPPL